ncbi:hypothetical protein, partial [Streptomyces sp. NPDC056291]|uniref:hypothetical protein n=1 Tax=Streptomyces sp. NPDC056291 TaxID=3345772 RepID=UPI0035DBB2FA
MGAGVGVDPHELPALAQGGDACGTAAGEGERPVPGRDPSRHCTGRAAFRPAAMTNSLTKGG